MLNFMHNENQNTEHCFPHVRLAKPDHAPCCWPWRRQGSSMGQLLGGGFNTIKPNHTHTLTAHTLGTPSARTHSTHTIHTAHTHDTHIHSTHSIHS